jgi:vancomycin permeability regulator SanA
MALIAVFSISLSIKNATVENIISPEAAATIDDVDYIIILGAGLRNDGSPSDMLTDRLLTGIDLIDRGLKGSLLLSGDNSGEHYNEVGAMYAFAVENGMDSEALVLDNEGFSTYESIYRAKEEFGAEKVIIVTQEYHLHRALYIARELGIEAYGVSADIRTYRGQSYRDLREHLARTKDFFKCLFE